jgi:nicotinate-nucleotide pyrophosphorylase (carboxylating)
MEAALALNTDASIQIEVEIDRRTGRSAGGRRESVLIDNFTLDMMREAVAINRGARCSKCRAA